MHLTFSLLSQQKLNIISLIKLGFVAGLLYWIAMDLAIWVCLINWHLGVLLENPSVKWSTADLLWLEMMRATAKKMLTCLSVRDMVDNANKVFLSDSYE